MSVLCIATMLGWSKLPTTATSANACPRWREFDNAALGNTLSAFLRPAMSPPSPCLDGSQPIWIFVRKSRRRTWLKEADVLGEAKFKTSCRDSMRFRCASNFRDSRFRDTKEIPEITDIRSRGGLGVQWRDPSHLGAGICTNLCPEITFQINVCLARALSGGVGLGLAAGRSAFPAFGPKATSNFGRLARRSSGKMRHWEHKRWLRKSGNFAISQIGGISSMSGVAGSVLGSQSGKTGIRRNPCKQTRVATMWAFSAGLRAMFRKDNAPKTSSGVPWTRSGGQLSWALCRGVAEARPEVCVRNIGARGSDLDARCRKR